MGGVTACEDDGIEHWALFGQKLDESVEIYVEDIFEITEKPGFSLTFRFDLRHN